MDWIRWSGNLRKNDEKKLLLENYKSYLQLELVIATIAINLKLMAANRDINIHVSQSAQRNDNYIKSHILLCKRFQLRQGIFICKSERKNPVIFNLVFHQMIWKTSLLTRWMEGGRVDWEGTSWLFCSLTIDIKIPLSQAPPSSS